MSSEKILFVHGRPAGHPLHAKYGKSITDHFSFEDPWIRWHDKNHLALIRYFAWLVNSLSFVSFRKQIVVTEGFRFTLVLSKLLSFNQLKLIMLVADESPYFLYSNYYKGLSHFFNKWGYKKYDGYLCIGEMEAFLVKEAVGSLKSAMVVNSINGISSEMAKKLGSNLYNPKSQKITFIGSGPSGWRMWYKGLDLMVEAFYELALTEHNLKFRIVGEWDSQIVLSFISSHEIRHQISLMGYQKDVSAIFDDSLLYLHMGRGDAWPISIMEAMAAGVVPIVSEWTGAKECVGLVSENLIVPLNKEEIVKRIKWFLLLSEDEKIRLSERCKEVASIYTEERAINKFKELFALLSSAIFKLK